MAGIFLIGNWPNFQLLHIWVSLLDCKYNKIDINLTDVFGSGFAYFPEFIEATTSNLDSVVSVTWKSNYNKISKVPSFLTPCKL